MIILTSYNRRSFIIGILSALIIGVGAYSLGILSGYESKELIKTSLPGINTLCNTIVLASATILALLLTLLSVSSGTKSKLKDEHYRQVLLIAKLDTIVFVVSMIVFQLLNLPLTESDHVPNHWYQIIYYSSLATSSLISGALCTVVVMLYNAVSSIIKIVGLDVDTHPLLHDEDGKITEDEGNKPLTESDEDVASEKQQKEHPKKQEIDQMEVDTYEEVKK